MSTGILLPTGAQGPQGPQGASGSQGAAGSQGVQGTQGTQGFQGPAGSQGAQGFQGDVGAQGTQGFQGSPGTQGNQGTQGTPGSQGAQGFQGAAGTFPQTVPNNGTNASFVGSGQTPASSGATAGNNQTATMTLDTDTMVFVITIGTERESIMCHTSYTASLVTAVSDPGNYFLASDAGTGIYVSKSASSDTVSFKNRMGGSRVITIQAINSNVTAATAWT